MIDARQHRINQYEELKIMPLDRFGLPKRHGSRKKQLWRGSQDRNSNLGLRCTNKTRAVKRVRFLRIVVRIELGHTQARTVVSVGGRD